jgi:hypothetical protein
MNEDRFERLARSSFDHLSAGAGQRQSRAEGHHLVAEPCRRICVRDAGGCLASSIIKPMVESMGLSLATRSALNLDGTQLHLDPDQTVVPHRPDS